MPVLQFKCECGEEFEKILPSHQELHKWCRHCDKLTIWIVIRDPQHELYKEKVCSSCLGNQHHAPLLSPADSKSPEGITEACPVCGKQAEHVLRVERRGTRSGGPGVGDSSVRFNFNYLSPDV